MRGPRSSSVVEEYVVMAMGEGQWINQCKHLVEVLGMESPFDELHPISPAPRT